MSVRNLLNVGCFQQTTFYDVCVQNHESAYNV